LKIISTDRSTNTYILTPQQESALESKQEFKKSALTVPRRPPWSPSTTPSALERVEKDCFLEWRPGLAQLQESDDLLLTPFERNLEVWRQLWQVIERSNLVVQIVDAWNPLLFWTEDLERYVKEVDIEKRNLLLINKADLMTEEQR
jgi:large subunit GTPase 1